MQRRNAVDWAVTGVDPSDKRFGKKYPQRTNEAIAAVMNPADVAGTVARTTHIVEKATDDYRNAEGYNLGKTRGAALTDKSKHPAVYGRPSLRSAVGEWGTADCMRGDFTAEEAAPDRDLGHSITPGFRNAGFADPGRAFGVPSIRTDVPARTVSVATAVDFGSGQKAGQLLFPSPYAEHGVDETDFTAPRSEKELKQMFGNVGYQMSGAEFAAFYARAATAGTITPPGSVCVQEMRQVINEVLAERDQGREPAWFARAMAEAEKALASASK
jgi:hypothetical protein